MPLELEQSINTNQLKITTTITNLTPFLLSSVLIKYIKAILTHFNEIGLPRDCCTFCKRKRDQIMPQTQSNVFVIKYFSRIFKVLN